MLWLCATEEVEDEEEWVFAPEPVAPRLLPRAMLSRSEADGRDEWRVGESLRAIFSIDPVSSPSWPCLTERECEEEEGGGEGRVVCMADPASGPEDLVGGVTGGEAVADAASDSDLRAVLVCRLEKVDGAIEPEESGGDRDISVPSEGEVSVAVRVSGGKGGTQDARFRLWFYCGVRAGIDAGAERIRKRDRLEQLEQKIDRRGTKQIDREREHQ